MKPPKVITDTDIILEYFQKNPDFISYESLHTILGRLKSPIQGASLDTVLEKLERDNYIFRPPNNRMVITVEGSVFMGYEKQLKSDRTSYRRRNVREFALTWGTVLAGIAASLLLVWQIYSYFHPTPNPCYVIQHAKTK